jgi:hypothetical protein
LKWELSTRARFERKQENRKLQVAICSLVRTSFGTGVDCSVEIGVDGDRNATRYLQIVVITIPWLILTGRLTVELVGLWIN